MATGGQVELGYVVEEMDEGDDGEESSGGQNYKLQSWFFPLGKVGGKPSWLAYEPLPSADQLACKSCQSPMAFLLQIYAPAGKERVDCFHRTLFVFVCRNLACSSNDGFAVFRCQLPRENRFYPNEPPPEPSPEHRPQVTVENFTKICPVCGCSAGKKCAKCLQVYYCSRQHQALHWTEGGHKRNCSAETREEMGNINSFLFPEYEVELEAESLPFDLREMGAELGKERSEADRMEDYRRYLEKNRDKLQDMAELNVRPNDVDEFEASAKKDKNFKRFRRITSENPQQILRYEKLGVPLQATDSAVDFASLAGVCSLCGAERKFEFQLMPHLLTKLAGADNLDWATVAVYTCSADCQVPNGGYATEVAEKQDFVD